MKCLVTAIACMVAPFAWAGTAIDQFQVDVVERTPQPRDYWVQGFEFSDGKLYISAGQYGASRLLRYDMDSGELDRTIRLPRHLFAEGLTLLDDTVFQLTWRSGKLLRYQRGDLAPKSHWSIPGEGWGLTNDGEALIYSDGSEHLHFLSPQDGRKLRTLVVTLNGRPLPKLNELEWVEGKIWANVWTTDSIVIIDPATGKVSGTIDLRGLLPENERRRGTDVLNGIARDPVSGDIWVTGKRWPWRYRIELRPLGPAS